jgi:hypothetical protein
VGIDHHIRVPCRNQLVEELRVQRVALDEIAVQVQVAAVATEAELLRAFLVRTRGVGAVQATVHVIDRDEQQHRLAQLCQALRLEAQVAHHGHAGVDAFRLAGVDAVIVEEDRAAFALDLFAVEHAVGADDANVDRDARVRDRRLLELQNVGEAACKLFIEGDAFGPQRGLVLVAFFVRREHFWHGVWISEVGGEVRGVGALGFYQNPQTWVRPVGSDPAGLTRV